MYYYNLQSTSRQQNPVHIPKHWTRFDLFVLSNTLKYPFPEVSFEAQECKFTVHERMNKSNRVQGFVPCPGFCPRLDFQPSLKQTEKDARFQVNID